MQDAQSFGVIVAVIAAAGLVAVLSSRLSERIRVPAPALFLAVAAIAGASIPAIHAPSHRVAERMVSIALALILFDGGMHLGWSRFRTALRSISLVGIPGTLLTAIIAATLVHFAFGIDWYISLLVGTAVAPTDPAVVFSVLGRREIVGDSGTILEGESGANDPVGIALMSSLIAAGGVGTGAIGHIAGEFVLQLGVGGALGAIGGRGLLWFMRRVPLPSEGLYALRTLAGALLIFGVATLAHGSGFLAVFVAGILIGDERAPYKREVQRFHGALASLSEIVAFVVLGLAVDLHQLTRSDVWIPGLVLGGVLALVIRPVSVGPFLVGSGLSRHERGFVLATGLKGAVPILLGTLLFGARISDAGRFFTIVVIVVVLSVVVQGGSVPALARLLRVPTRTVEPEPWALGVRLRDEPQGVHRITVASGSSADGRTLADVPLSDDAWVSFAIRRGRILPMGGGTQIQADDELLILADPELREELLAVFARPAPTA